MNYCGDRTRAGRATRSICSPHKQGRFLPGVQIPIHAPERIFATRPDYVLILPWNLKDEITDANGRHRQWGGRFVVAVPTLSVLD